MTAPPRFASRALLLAGILLAPRGAHGASLSIQGNAVVLGRTESVPVLIRVDEPPGSENRPLRLSVNVGSFSVPVRVGPGQYKAVYVPPQTRFPQVALAAVWRETGPDAQIDFLSFPLFGMTRIPVTSAPGATVTFTVGFDEFGPARADRRGRVEVPIVVAPGVREARAVVAHRGVSTTKVVPIDVPPYNRLTAAVVPHAIAADAESHARIDVLYELGGVDVPPDRLHVRASTGTVRLQSASRGRYVYRYEPPAGTEAKEARLEVRVDGDPAARAEATIALALQDPSRMIVRPPPAALAAGSDGTATVSVLVLDAEGLGLPCRRLEASANGAPLGKALYQGSGLHELAFRPPATYPAGGIVQLRANCQAPSGAVVSAASNYQLMAAPAARAVAVRFRPEPVPADGRTAALVLLDVRDAAGLPLRGAQLMVAASHGTVGTLRERGAGIYETTFLSPAEPPEGETILRVVDAGGTFERSLPVPLRADPRRLLLGLRGGFTRGAGDLSGGRVGLDALIPIRVGGSWLGVGATASVGTASRTISDASSGFSVESRALFLPVALRAGYELWAARRLSFTVGAGAVAAFARVENDLAAPSSAWGVGGIGFFTAAMALGRGHAFAEASYSWSPVETSAFRLDPGGAGVEVGYRIGVF